jgi:hypothetical protein
MFDAGVEVARNASVAGATLASAAIAASAWYDNPLTGTGALRECLRTLSDLPYQLPAWRAAWAPRPQPETMDPDWVPGFGFVTSEQERAVLSAAARLHQARRGCAAEDRLGFFLKHATRLADVSGALNATGLAALVLADHSTPVDEAEQMYLMARLDAAIREAARARAAGLHKFPFFSQQYCYEGSSPPVRRLDLDALMQQVGL